MNSIASCVHLEFTNQHSVQYTVESCLTEVGRATVFKASCIGNVLSM